MSQELDAVWYNRQIAIVNKRNAQLESVNAALLGALRKIEMLAESSERIDQWPYVTTRTLLPVVRAAIAEAETTGGKG